MKTLVFLLGSIIIASLMHFVFVPSISGLSDTCVQLDKDVDELRSNTAENSRKFQKATDELERVTGHHL